MSPPNQGGENGHEAKEDDASFAAAGRRRFEIEEVEDREALEGAASGDGVVAGLIAWARAACAPRDVERAAEARAVD